MKPTKIYSNGTDQITKPTESESMPSATSLVLETEQREDPIVELRSSADEQQSVSIGSSAKSLQDSSWHMAINAYLDRLAGPGRVVALVVIREDRRGLLTDIGKALSTMVSHHDGDDEATPINAGIEDSKYLAVLVTGKQGADDFHDSSPLVVTESSVGLGFKNELCIFAF